jgi:hypothetical protein
LLPNISSRNPAASFSLPGFGNVKIIVATSIIRLNKHNKIQIRLGIIINGKIEKHDWDDITAEKVFENIIFLDPGIALCSGFYAFSNSKNDVKVDNILEWWYRM